MFSGVSGLKSHQTRMDVIGNNIANVNTTGFKSSRVTFADMISQTLSGASAPGDTIGGTNPKQIGLGTSVSSTDLLFNDASVQSTGKNTDLALTGNGLFVVKQGNETYYTRNGAFEFDADGKYVMPGSGLRVQGWSRNKDTGEMNTRGTPSDIIIPKNLSMPPSATKEVKYTNNLNASTTSAQAKRARITYADGTTEETDAYAPNILSKIEISGKSAGTYEVPRIDGKTPTYTLGKMFTKRTDKDKSAIWKSKTVSAKFTTIAAATSQRELDVAVTGKDGTPMKINGGTTFSIDKTQIPVGTYKPGDTFTGTAVIKGAVLDTATHTVTLYFDANGDGTGAAISSGPLAGLKSVVVPEPTSGGMYAVGGTFTLKTTITKVVADEGDTVNLENGQSPTLNAADLDIADDIPQEVGKDYTKYIAGTVKAVNDHVGYSYKGKKVQSIDLLADDGRVINGEISKTLANQRGIPGYVLTLFSVFDSEGGKFDLPVMLQKTADNRWQAVFSNGSTTYKFKRSDGVEVTATLNATDIVFDTHGARVSGSGTINIDYSNGLPASGQTVKMEFEALTQYTGSSTVHAESDGYTQGTLSKVTIDSTGSITGTYTNNVKRVEAQIAVAQFNNASGLSKQGGSLYQETNNSGGAHIKTADTAGVTVTASALEMSNVDIADQFSDMIVTQRGFQSNSKIITVSDEMLETLINMKR